MDSNTKEFTTENGHKVVYKSFITFGEKRAINTAFTAAAKASGGQISPAEMAAQLNAGTDKAIETVIISIDDKTTDLVNEFMKLPNADGLQLIDIINEVTENKKKEVSTAAI